ncbi:hypothetical protein KDA_60740 [Dictyobacter alpinus]|uniref:Polyketide cyclase n=1 Tax=Dictyobacter alpinus TaxID=2014873 RepID=A0A402BH36_9CHLR|nr:SRPBCC domain-containing protein [Dictyobacter alpinus]GCE30590.1 hypothetical protein KDA_60740 [Dictyobacter alpinus]
MPKMRFQTVIQRQPEPLYQLILDLSGYKAWLPSSTLYSETALTSDYPLQVGSSYVDRGQASIMYGEITVLEPGKRIVFRQTTNPQLHSFFKNSLTITIYYTLEPVAKGTSITRECTIQAQGIFILAQGLLLHSMRQENTRILAAMKSYMESRVA